MSLYRFNKVEKEYYNNLYLEDLEDLVDVDNLINVIDIVFPGIRDMCATWDYYPDECEIGQGKHYLIPRRVQFKNSGFLYDDKIFDIKREAEALRYERWKRNLNRKYAGNYGVI